MQSRVAVTVRWIRRADTDLLLVGTDLFCQSTCTYVHKRQNTLSGEPTIAYESRVPLLGQPDRHDVTFSPQLELIDTSCTLVELPEKSENGMRPSGRHGGVGPSIFWKGFESPT